MLKNRLTTLALLLILVPGCGTSPTGAGLKLTTLKKPVAGSVSASPAALVVKAPAAHRGTGALTMAFQFPTRAGYTVQAVGADIETLVVTVKTRSFLLLKTVASTQVNRAQVKGGLANVKFTELKAGEYTVEVEALNASGQALGKASGGSAVTEGKVSPLAINLQLDGSHQPAPGMTGGLAIRITVQDGHSPTPAPTPTPVPSTPVGGAFNTNVDVLRQGAFKGCLFGASTKYDLETTATMATKLGRGLDVNHSFYRWDDAVPSTEDKADIAAGIVPFISWNAITNNGTPVKWASVADGAQDARIREVARGIKALNKPVFFTFNHEPENDAVKGTPAEYKAAWKRVSDLFRAEGAHNAVKVFVMMGFQADDTFYPGADVVDWVGGDPYNWAFSSRQPGAKWRSFEQAAGPFYAWAKTKGKPVMISETGCVEDPTNPGAKAQWIAEMGATLKKWPEFKALCYFNNHDMVEASNKGWYLHTPQAIAAFKALGQDPYFAKH